MSADISRVRFDPLRDHSGVGIQQGRLWLDAEFNEQVAIADRRARAQVADLAPTPVITSRLTPDAFKVELSGGKLSIGAGRMYVDGLLAENHGTGTSFDPVLAEVNGTGAIDYQTQQPYWPDPMPPDLPTSPGPHLVFLDVWERELDHLNAPHLVEPAVGVETTTRTQVAWQVRVLPDVGDGVTCDSPTPPWTEQVASSSARLTTGTVDVDPVTDPCEIPPGKGYRGPENQLYRVQLHSATQFTWSRDNGAVASAVEQVISNTELRLSSLGRDDVLSIKDNDWVEVIDDLREFAHLPGEMRQVTVTPGTTIVTLSAGLPTDLAASTHHLRVRKWDSGLIDIPSDGSAVVLEHGVTVAFSFAPTGAPRPGDYWVFAARVADASIEELVAAPPRGIHHHYARLALITETETAADCRPDWPAAGGDGCACEICVTPDSHASGELTIQDAIDILKKAQGGTVTLCPGDYELAAPLQINGATSVTLRGAGPGSRLLAPGAAVVVSDSHGVTLRGFAVTGKAEAPAVALVAANLACRLDSLTVSSGHTAVGLTGVLSDLTVRDCRFESPTGIGALTQASLSDGASFLTGAVAAPGPVKPYLLTTELSVTGNAFACGQIGIDLGIEPDAENGRVCQHVGRTAISGNTMRECAVAGMVVTGLVPDETGETVGALDITGNLLEVTGSGIVTGGRARVSDNTVRAAARVAGQQGIVLAASPPDAPRAAAHVLANQVTGFAGVGITATAPWRCLVVKHNIVRGTGGGIQVQPTVPGGQVSVDNNQIADLRLFTEPLVGMVALVHQPPDADQVAESDEPTVVLATVAAGRGAAGATAATRVAGATRVTEATRTGDAGGTVVAAAAPVAGASAVLAATRAAGTVSGASMIIGIWVMGVAAASVVGNTVDGLADGKEDTGELRTAAGIAVFSCGDVRVSGNTVAQVGSPGASTANAYGIYVSSWGGAVSVGDNVVLGGAGPEPVARPGWTALTLKGDAEGRVAGVRSVRTAAGVWSIAGEFAALQQQTLGHVELNGNTLYGGAEDPAVVVTTGGDVVMSANRCEQPGTGAQHVVRMAAGVALVQGNRLRGGRPSMTMTVGIDSAIVLGNVTSGGIQINGTPVEGYPDKPWSSLNPVA